MRRAVVSFALTFGFKHIQRIEKWSELGETEISHVKVGISLSQQISYLSNENLLVLFGVLLYDGTQGPSDGAQTGFGFLDGRLF